MLLHEFYENHKTSYDNILTVSACTLGYLNSIGADRQLIRTEEVKAWHLDKYRKEMKAFTVLKQKFMNSDK